MATVTTITLVDDLDESPADETVVFGFNGAEYEIDLSERNARALRRAFARYIEHGRKAPRGSGRRGSTSRTARLTATRAAVPSAGPTTAEVREWAKSQGIDVSERGRMSEDVFAQYRAAHAGS